MGRHDQPTPRDRMGLDGMSRPGRYRLGDPPSSVWPPPVRTEAAR